MPTNERPGNALGASRRRLILDARINKPYRKYTSLFRLRLSAALPFSRSIDTLAA
jgi:hypothetical protein